jgi:molybdopterin adenylyltransferase
MTGSRTAFVLTVSDRSAAGTRPDASGASLGSRLSELGFAVERAVVPDDVETIAAALRGAVARHRLVLTTGGTGLTPRDVTPQATATVLEYEVPGIAEAMRADGRRSTPFAVLSRGLVGVASGALVVNLPGSPHGAIDSFETLVAVLDHALETLSGPFDHQQARAAGRSDLPDMSPAPEDA